VILEGLTAVDEDDRDFIVELASEFVVGVNIDLMPGKASAARELGEALFHDLAQVTSLAGVDDDIARLWHADEF
jgi:hypothetical protein